MVQCADLGGLAFGPWWSDVWALVVCCSDLCGLVSV